MTCGGRERQCREHRDGLLQGELAAALRVMEESVSERCDGCTMLFRGLVGVRCLQNSTLSDTLTSAPYSTTASMSICGDHPLIELPRASVPRDRD